MKVEDINLLKGKAKNAIQTWASYQVDAMFPGSATMRAFGKRAVGNLLARYDAKINSFIDYIAIGVADEKGTIDTDTMIDTFAGIFNELKPNEYHVGGFDIYVGGGEMIIDTPRNIVLDMLVGFGRIKFNSADLLQLKEYFT